MTNPKFRQVGHASQRGLIERNGTVYKGRGAKDSFNFVECGWLGSEYIGFSLILHNKLAITFDHGRNQKIPPHHDLYVFVYYHHAQFCLNIYWFTSAI